MLLYAPGAFAHKTKVRLAKLVFHCKLYQFPTVMDTGGWPPFSVGGNMKLPPLAEVVEGSLIRK